MRKKIFTSLLASILAFSMFTTSFASGENNDVNDISVADEIAVVGETIIGTDKKDIEKKTDEVIENSPSEKIFDDELTGNDNAQVNIIPIMRNNKDSLNQQGVSLMSANNMSSLNKDDNPTITNVYSQDFYADTATFEIQLSIRNLNDSRQKLKIAVVDENNEVIAEQIGVYYDQNGLVYQMKLVQSVDATDYYIRFSYTGKYKLEYEIYDASIVPITNVNIKNIEVINYDKNSFRLELANASEGTKYTLFYVEEGNGASVKKDATVTKDKSLYVEFENDFAFSRYNYIWLCPYGSTYFSYSNCIDYKGLYNFNFEESNTENSNDGVYCNDYISTSNTTAWFSMSSKGFGGQKYNSSDVSQIDVYMLDMTTGETVGTMNDIGYREEYNQINGYITFNTKLDKTHKYIMVFNDGYSVRVDDRFVITSEKKLSGVTPYDSNKEYLRAIPVGTKTFYAYVSSVNINDRENIKVELIDSNGKTAATSSYESGSRYHLMKVKNALSVGEYTLKATYNNLVYSKTINVGVGSTCYQLVRDVTAYNGKTYIGVTLETQKLNPADLTYKLILNDGTEKSATYYRSLYNDGNYKYFVLILDEELTGINYDNEAVLKIYDGTDYIAPYYDNSMHISYVQWTSQPFLYDKYKITDTSAELYIEGLSTAGTVNMCAYDDMTKTGVAVAAADCSKNSVIFNNSDLSKIYTKYTYGSRYTNKAFFIELNDEYMSYIWSNNFGSAVVDDEFGFQRAYTGRTYEVLNLPYNTYAYYKLASSESELSSKSYQKIDVGVLYRLKELQGEQTVYAQFKTSDGEESDVQTTSIIMDTITPKFDVTTDIPSVFVIDEYNNFKLECGVETNEPGQIHFVFYDDDNNMIGYDNITTRVNDGYSNAIIDVWADSYNYEDAAKLVIYMTDNAGNKSKEYSFNISVKRKFTEYTSGETYLKINNETGMIVEAESTGTTIYIPAEINGVAVTAIGEYAFADTGKALRISIPDSVTSIDEFAFDDLDDFTLLVKENSVAHRFALANDISFELVTYKKGDVLSDGVVNSKDAVRLAQYLAKWDITLADDEKQAADVVADGTINSKDAVKLSQYLAKWDVNLD